MLPRNIPIKSGVNKNDGSGDGDMNMASPTITPINTSTSTSSTPSLPNAFARNPTSPIRFASTTNAFGLSASPSSSTSSTKDLGGGSRDFVMTGMTDNSPPSAGTVATRRLRRPSMLSLAQTAARQPDSEGTSSTPFGESLFHRSRPNQPALPNINTALPALDDPSSSKANPHFGIGNINGSNPFSTEITAQPTPKWPTNTSFLANSLIRRTSSAPSIPIEGLRTNTPPRQPDHDNGGVSTPEVDSGSASPMDLEGSQAEYPPARSPLRWMPTHLQPQSARRKGKAKMEDQEMSPNPSTNPPTPAQFSGRPIPANLLATLISESAPLEHEMQSEARLQRLLSSHPKALPFTPRVSRSSRGRFPETAGDDDDDDDFSRSTWPRASWVGASNSSDSDSDDAPMDDTFPEPVNAAFAAGMDMDRPTSSSSSGPWQSVQRSRSDSNSGSGSNHQPTPPPSNPNWPRTAARMSFSAAGAGLIPSPGPGGGLPNAFGGLGMGGQGNGIGTPLGSPTVEKLDLLGSPSSVASPGMMQYRDSSSASVRPGKRKAQDDRFDPYKRPRGSSPSLLGTSPALAVSPSRSTTGIPTPQSPIHMPYYSSTLSNTGNNIFAAASRQNRSNHAYRPLSSRSRQASPALSIGSTSGVLSTSLGNSSHMSGGTHGTRPSVSLGQAFIPTGAGSGGLYPPGQAPQALGGLGLLSLGNRAAVEESEEGGMEMMREGSNMSREAMEED